MEPAEKLALAQRIVELSAAPFLPRPVPPGRPQPPPEVLARLEEMGTRRKALLAEVYAERLSEAQLRALETHHGSDHARAIAAELPAIHAEVSKRFTELWGNGKFERSVQVTPTSGATRGSVHIAMATDASPPDRQREEAIVRSMLEDARYIQTTHAHLVREYLKAVERGATGAELARFYTRDAEQVEQPNRLNPNGGCSDLATLLARAEKGKQLLSAQSYELLSLVAEGQTVAAEARWTGTLAIPVGTLAAGAQIRAHLAMFFEMKDGLIHRQRNYDCFEAW